MTDKIFTVRLDERSVGAAVRPVEVLEGEELLILTSGPTVKSKGQSHGQRPSYVSPIKEAFGKVESN